MSCDPEVVGPVVNEWMNFRASCGLWGGGLNYSVSLTLCPTFLSLALHFCSAGLPTGVRGAELALH